MKDNQQRVLTKWEEPQSRIQVIREGVLPVVPQLSFDINKRIIRSSLKEQTNENILNYLVYRIIPAVVMKKFNNSAQSILSSLITNVMDQVPKHRIFLHVLPSEEAHIA